MTYGFINFLFLFLSHISFIFSFTYLVFTASISISTLPYSFFFPLPFCSMIFPFMNMSHYRFPLYHYWSIKSHSLVFFPPLFALSSLFYLRVADLLFSESPIRYSGFGWFGGFWVCDWVLILVEVVGGESGGFDGLCWSCGLWLQWVDSGDLGWGCGLRLDHGSCLRLGFDLDWGWFGFWFVEIEVVGFDLDWVAADLTSVLSHRFFLLP